METKQNALLKEVVETFGETLLKIIENGKFNNMQEFEFEKLVSDLEYYSGDDGITINLRHKFLSEKGEKNEN